MMCFLDLLIVYIRSQYFFSECDETYMGSLLTLNKAVYNLITEEKQKVQQK